MSDKDGNPFPSLNRHPSEWARVLKEHRCWQAFLGANDAYEEWHAMLVQKEQEQVEFERYEKQYGQHGGGGQQRGFVPLEAAYPLSAREVAAATDTETLYAHAVGAKEFGEKTWERVQMQCNEVHTKQVHHTLLHAATRRFRSRASPRLPAPPRASPRLPAPPRTSPHHTCPHHATVPCRRRRRRR